MAFAFTPATGLLNTTSFVTKPTSETAARQQFMTLFYQLRDYINKHSVIISDTGVADALIVTIDLTITDYTDTVLFVKVNNTNTGASTIDINEVGAVAIKKNGSEDLIAGDLVEDGYALLVFDGTQYQLLNAKNDLTTILSNISTLQSNMTTAQNDIDTAESNIVDLQKWRYITLVLA